MKCHLLRWALLCVAAAPCLLLPHPAEASQTVVIGPGDSIDSLARKYHVAVKDIARANGISPDAMLRDGRKLLIPDPPHSVKREATMRKYARVKGDRITIRLGPDENYRRLTLLDHGTEVILNRQAGDWYQIELPSGRTGWMRSDFLSMGSKGGNFTPSQIARTAPRSEKTVKSQPVRIARKSRVRAESAGERRHRLALARMTKKQRAAAIRHELALENMSSKERRALARQTRKLQERRRIARRHDEDDRPTRRSQRRRIVNHVVKKSNHSYASASHSRRRGSRPEADAPDTDTDVVRTAYAYRGVPYHFGGTSRNGFDCSGFTGYVYRKKGVSLPRTAAEQFSRGKRVSSKELKAGDLVFFHTTRRGVSHVGIYAGEGKFVHASSGGGRVRVDSLSSGYYKSRLVGARRVK